MSKCHCKFACNNSLTIANIWLAQSQKQLNETEAQKVRTEIEYIISKNLREWAEYDSTKQNADTYKKWVEGKLPQMEKELEIRAQELGVEKTRVVLNTIGEVLHTGGLILGASMMGKGGKGVAGATGETTPIPRKRTATFDATTRKFRITKNNEIYDY